ncbi:MAG: hypothetical protein ABSD92_00750 [Candidatus Bathyarchaeia archaeon]|jgi:predicted NUDIX family phosphoesterase
MQIENTNQVEEKVLCFPRALLGSYSSQVIFFDQFIWDKIQTNLFRRPRSIAERDTMYKQLVAYVVIKLGKKYLTYKRTEKGNEERLWTKYSIGVGGHVNEEDSQRFLFDSGFFDRAVRREIDEEVIFEKGFKLSAPRLSLFINDDLDDVGKVHFGLIWVAEIEQDINALPESNMELKKVAKGKKGLCDLEFCDVDSLKAGKSSFERWSQIIIDYIYAGGKLDK